MKSRAFTIVELLIVIVVIGILSAIVMVTYNNVQARAQTAVQVAMASSVESVLKSYYSANGSLPETTVSGGIDFDGGGTSNPVLCLGGAYPADGDFADGQCMIYLNMPGGSVDESFNSELAKIATISGPSLKPIGVIGEEDGTVVKVQTRGIVLVINSRSSVNIIYGVPGEQCTGADAPFLDYSEIDNATVKGNICVRTVDFA